MLFNTQLFNTKIFNAPSIKRVTANIGMQSNVTLNGKLTHRKAVGINIGCSVTVTNTLAMVCSVQSSLTASTQQSVKQVKCSPIKVDMPVTTSTSIEVLGDVFKVVTVWQRANTTLTGHVLRKRRAQSTLTVATTCGISPKANLQRSSVAMTFTSDMVVSQQRWRRQNVTSPVASDAHVTLQRNRYRGIDLHAKTTLGISSNTAVKVIATIGVITEIGSSGLIHIRRNRLHVVMLGITTSQETQITGRFNLPTTLTVFSRQATQCHVIYTIASKITATSDLQTYPALIQWKVFQSGAQDWQAQDEELPRWIREIVTSQGWR